MIIDSISLLIDERFIFISKNKYNLPFISKTLEEWFIYSLQQGRYILTSKLFKAIIRIVNKKIFTDEKTMIGETDQQLIFVFKENSERNITSFLENVI